MTSIFLNYLSTFKNTEILYKKIRIPSLSEPPIDWAVGPVSLLADTVGPSPGSPFRWVKVGVPPTSFTHITCLDLLHLGL